MHIRNIIALILCLLLFSCQDGSGLKYDIPENTGMQALNINIDSIKIVGDPGNFAVKKEILSGDDGVQFITFTFTSVEPVELQPVSIEFNFPSIDINGYWNPKISMDKVNYYHMGISSKASRYAPVLSFYNNALKNRLTISLSDALNQSEISSYLKEEDVHFYQGIKLFSEKMPATREYSITLRIDTRPVPYYSAIEDVASWWADECGYTPMFVPDDAVKPMYSTWYSYHQGITAEEIVAECKIAKTLGCGAVIVDDGWQTNDGSRGYAYTGDWIPERIPDMKGFVDAVHDVGMKFILWYSLPFMGEKAKNYDRFKGKYLRHWESQGTYVLDPRYPEVREYIINTYINAIEDWNLDGFKLDFIGWFTANNETVLTKEDGRDYASVNNATDALMTEITEKLSAVKPDILIEFRQPYIGPLMRMYGNMFRGVDAPNNAVANRVEVTNLRIMAQNTAVHSDMFIWRREEKAEQAALQILNILYSVPQLSVKLAEVPEQHLDMIRFWFDYWNKNRHILIDGKFIPSNPGANYPVLTVRDDGKQITTLYEDLIVSADEGIEQLDIINAKASSKTVLRLNTEIVGTLRIMNCMGTVVHEKDVSLSKGIHEFLVPQSGLMSLTK